MSVKTNGSVGRAQNNSRLLKPKTYRSRWLIAAIIGTITLGAFFITWNIALGGGNVEEHAQAAAYLQKKYGKPFVVVDDPNPMVKRAVGDPPKFDGLAHPKDQPSLTFWVGRQTDPPGEFRDTFLGTYWAKQQRAPVEAFLKTVFKIAPDFSIEIYPSERIQNLPHSSIPNYETILKETPNEIHYYLTVRVKADLTDETRTEHAEHVLALLKYVRQGHGDSAGIRYVINTTINGEKYRYIYDPPGSQQQAIKTTQDIIEHLDDFKNKGWE